MKKLILLALVTLVMTGCRREKISTRKDGWTIVTIDSCEYIECTPYGRMLIHKNNCRFCEERRKAEIEEFTKTLWSR